MALQRLKEGAEKAKCELSSGMQTDINLPFITADASGSKHLNYSLSRAKLEQITEELLKRTKEPCVQALKDAGLSASDIDEVILVGGMTRMPAVGDIVKGVFNREPSRGVNPDEVVADGAAIQAGVLSGDVKDVLLLDVTPLTLGIETIGGVSTPLIERNTTIPVNKQQIFSTAEDNQSIVTIHVLQGEREFANDNRTLGNFNLEGIAPGLRGSAQIEVRFDIDANGIVHVSAKDLGTGKEQKIRIESSSGLNEGEINRMVQDAEAHADEDRKRKTDIELRNNADNLVYSSEKILSESDDAMPGEDRAVVENAVQTLKEALNGSDIGMIEGAISHLAQAVQKLSDASAAAASAGRPGQAEGGADYGDAETAGAGAAVDADFKVVNDE
jgi:molecular chaperone DnaK